MTYRSDEARGGLLEDVATAANALGQAIAALGEAYEALDDDSADALEEQLFRPVQVAYGRIRRTHDEFAARHGLPPSRLSDTTPGNAWEDARGAIERALDSIDEAEQTLSELQDSMAPVEVGDPPLRAGLADVRQVTGDLVARGEKFLSLLGR